MRYSVNKDETLIVLEFRQPATPRDDSEGDLRPDLNATFISVACAYDAHFLLPELDDAFPLQFLDRLHYLCESVR